MKKVFGKALCAASVLALALGGLTACGGGDPMENAALAKENVYRMQEISLPDLGGDDSSIRSSYLYDGKLYVLAQVYHWDDTPHEYKLVAANQDGSDATVITLEMPGKKNKDMFGLGVPGGEDADPGQNEGSEESPDSQEPADDGETAGEEEPEGEEVPPADDSEADVDIGVDEDFFVDEWGYDGEDSEWEDTYFGTIVFGNGRLYMQEYYYYEYQNYSDPDSYIYLRKTYICSWGLDGSLMWEADLGELQSDEEYIYLNTMIPCSDGSLRLILSGNTAYRQDISADGVLGSRDTFSGDNADLLSRANILPKNDGTLLLLYYDENDWSKQYIVNYDPETDRAGEPKLAPPVFAAYGYNSMSAGLNSDIIYSDSYGVYAFNAGDEEGTKKMDFINSDLGISYFQSLTELDENTFLGLFADENYETKGGIFTYVKPEDIPDKKVLVLAADYIGSDLRSRVVEFNRNSDEYRITLRAYESYNSMDDWNAGITRLNNDIITGNMPDILVAAGLPVENYIAKGLILDIGKLIEEDEELSQAEFVQNVFDAYRVDGKLYYVIPSFYVRSLIGKVSLLGDRTTWTMADMLKLKETLPEETSLFGTNIVRSDFLYYVMQYCGSDFVDVDTGKCKFDSPDFIAMMEFAKTLPEELSDNYWYDYDWEVSQSQYRENRTVLLNFYISSFSNMNYYINGYIGEDVSFIGFPTDSGQGSVVGIDTSYCISAKSANKEAAWEFLRYYLTDEYQDEITYNLPIRKDRFEELAQEATKRPHYTDPETGEVEEWDDYFYMNGEDIILPPLTQEQVDKCVNFIYSVDKRVYTNDDIMNIINEEIEAFYSGQKSAEDVAGIIQSRVQVYVDENR